jgi:hypothetical protein
MSVELEDLFCMGLCAYLKWSSIVELHTQSHHHHVLLLRHRYLLMLLLASTLPLIILALDLLIGIASLSLRICARSFLDDNWNLWNTLNRR